MNDDDRLQQRLTAMGRAPAPPMTAHDVDRLEGRLLQGYAALHPQRRRAWAIVATAAAVLLVAGLAYGLQRGDDPALEPAEPPLTAVLPTSTAPSTALPASTATPSTPATSDPAPTNPVDTTTGSTLAGTVPPATVPAATAPAATTTAPPPSATTTLPPASEPVPPASFTLTVERVGNRLVFHWPAYAGPRAGAIRYVLVRVPPAGLQHWPVVEARIARVVLDPAATRLLLDQPDTTPATWVLAVVDADRHLIAVSTVAASS